MSTLFLSCTSKSIQLVKQQDCFALLVALAVWAPVMSTVTNLTTAPFKVEQENLNKKLANKKLTSASSIVQVYQLQGMKKEEEVPLFLPDKWVTLTYSCCFIEPIGQHCFVPFANFCNSYSQMVSFEAASNCSNSLLTHNLANFCYITCCVIVHSNVIYGTVCTNIFAKGFMVMKIQQYVFL